MSSNQEKCQNLFALPKYPLSRRLFRRRRRALAKEVEDGSSLNRLNDDILLEICAMIKLLAESTDWRDHRSTSRKTPLSRRLHDVTNGTEPPLSLFSTAKQTLDPFRAFSVTSRRMRYLCARTMFKNIQIGKYWSWSETLRALDSIALCEPVREYARSFRIDVRINRHIKEPEDRTARGPRPPSRLPRKLLEVLTGLPNLEKLTLIIPYYNPDYFREIFENANVSFPNIRTLVLGQHMEWVIALCPNVETITNHGDRCCLPFGVADDHGLPQGTNLIYSASRMPGLRHFEMVERWTLAQLEIMYQAMPWIQSLAMPGDTYADGIETMLPTLSRFKNLTNLALAYVSELKVGFEIPFVCTMGEGFSEEERQRLHEKIRQAEERTARMVFTRMHQLDQLWIGHRSEAKVTRTESGKVDKILWAYHLRPTVYGDQ
ncbi:MAG: hypothetical protein Q9170_002682 [Blastenia crenularia]